MDLRYVLKTDCLEFADSLARNSEGNISLIKTLNSANI